MTFFLFIYLILTQILLLLKPQFVVMLIISPPVVWVNLPCWLVVGGGCRCTISGVRKSHLSPTCYLLHSVQPNSATARERIERLSVRK